MSQTTGTGSTAETLSFTYDADGKPVSITYKQGSNAAVTYFYAYNGQGDVIAIYNSSNSTLVGSYEYDLWGKLISATPASSSSDPKGILTKNPFRYRGYYYDNETGYYYLNTRYYDPQVRRFISADDMIPEVGSSVQGHNLFAYSFNDPINLMDDSGEWPRKITLKAKETAQKVAEISKYTGKPELATTAYFCEFMLFVLYETQSYHYDARKALNTCLPVDQGEADSIFWTSSENGGPSAACHQYSCRDSSNVKYVSPDGYREVIFNSAGQLVTDPRDIGTYNFCPSSRSKLGHLVLDIIPWVIFGNDDDDPGPLCNEIIKRMEIE